MTAVTQGPHSQHERHIISEGYPTIRYQQVVYQLTSNTFLTPKTLGARGQFRGQLELAPISKWNEGVGPKGHGSSQTRKSNFLNWRVVTQTHVLGSLQGTALDVLATQFRADSWPQAHHIFRFFFWHSRSPRESPIGALAWREAVGPRRDSQCVSIHNKSVSTLFISISLYSFLFISIYLYLLFYFVS